MKTHLVHHSCSSAFNSLSHLAVVSVVRSTKARDRSFRARDRSDSAKDRSDRAMDRSERARIGLIELGIELGP